MKHARKILQATLVLAFTVGAPVVPAARSQSPAATSQNAECLACHGQAGVKSESGKSIFMDPAKHKASVHAALSCSGCHSDIQGFPHPTHIKKVECSSCHAQESADVLMSVHGALGPERCTSCHGSAHEARPSVGLAPPLCRACHAGEVKDLRLSAHGAAEKKSDTQAPTCFACHGPVHKISAAADPHSPVARKNQPGTCGACHSDPGFLTNHQIPFAHPVESYRASMHGRAVAAGNSNAASCSDCHSAHAILSARDPLSTVNHWNVPGTCAKCHSEIAKTYSQSVHGHAVANGALDAPVCTDCHGDHAILGPNEPQSSINPARVSIVTCGRCHGDARLAAQYNLPADRVPTFADSYHGLAARSGSQSVANCASCHGVHNILPSSDPRSTVNAANLAHTCGACHTGAGKTFAIGAVHVSGSSRSESAVVKVIRWIYWFLIPLTIGFMVFHHALDFWRKSRAKWKIDDSSVVPRLDLHFRIAHGLTVASFPLLVLTGFALKFPESWWARPLLVWEGRFAFRGTLHRIAAVLLLISLVYYAVSVFLRRDHGFWRAMRPGWNDLRDLTDMLLYNLGFLETRPTFGRFSYVEKIELFAFLWGTAVMAATGFLLWFNTLALRYFPKWVTDAGTALHFYEAILATSAIAVWHMYTVIFDPDVYPMDRSWLTGNVPAAHLRDTRPAYYSEVVSAQGPARPAERGQPGVSEAFPTQRKNPD